MTDTKHLTDTYDEILKHGKVLTQLMLDTKLLDSRAYALPTIHQENEGEHPTYIDVAKKSGFEALSINNRKLFEYTAPDNHSFKEASRSPGMSCFMPSAANTVEFRKLVDEINRLKENFQQASWKLGSHNARFNIIHEIFPRLVVLMVYRKIKIYEDPNILSFRWANKKYIKNYTKVEIKTILENSEHKPPMNTLTSPEEWRFMIEQEMNDLSRVSGDRALKIIRPLKVQPIINVDHKGNSCSQPAIVLSSCNTPKIKDLMPYNELEQKPRGRKSPKMELIIPRLQLFASIL
jgi:DNA replication terminus site-binding protein